jgi:hypothetical protein
MNRSDEDRLRLLLVPCSCGANFVVSSGYDQRGSQWDCFLTCPNCGKRHDPRNRLLHLGYHSEGYWKVDGC